MTLVRTDPLVQDYKIDEYRLRSKEASKTEEEVLMKGEVLPVMMNERGQLELKEEF